MKLCGCGRKFVPQEIINFLLQHLDKNSLKKNSQKNS